MTYSPSLKQLWRQGELARVMGSVVDKTLSLVEPGLRLLPSRSSALATCVRFILDRVDDGGYGAFWTSNFGAVVALIAEGFPIEHPLISHLLRAIERYIWEDSHGLRMQVTHGPVWDTGLMALGLLESGSKTEGMDCELFPDRIHDPSPDLPQQ
jgi:squalene-hopene/tetraprenyl-beta-curcumene cyclase